MPTEISPLSRTVLLIDNFVSNHHLTMRSLIGSPCSFLFPSSYSNSYSYSYPLFRLVSCCTRTCLVRWSSTRIFYSIRGQHFIVSFIYCFTANHHCTDAGVRCFQSCFCFLLEGKLSCEFYQPCQFQILPLSHASSHRGDAVDRAADQLLHLHEDSHRDDR